ncbi:hypothetical protein D9619_003529 [Psilocybe cf. subviscida]|uniref:Uncharacterized protein n=1 Tax=Psilocybe cf. subviscida TaxID=2480587 RepID=A0A8H5ETZ7_9AGAR|nr:hypothetical protein D9619_003529 [Psilocybe cf. subviscida]
MDGRTQQPKRGVMHDNANTAIRELDDLQSADTGQAHAGTTIHRRDAQAASVYPRGVDTQGGHSTDDSSATSPLDCLAALTSVFTGRKGVHLGYECKKLFHSFFML